MIGLILALSRLEQIKLLLDAGKVAVDGWAVVDDRRQRRREEQRDQRVQELEDRIAALESRRRKR